MNTIDDEDGTSRETKTMCFCLNLSRCSGNLAKRTTSEPSIATIPVGNPGSQLYNLTRSKRSALVDYYLRKTHKGINKST